MVSFTRDGQPVMPLTRPPVIKIQKATYGVPGDAARTRDVQGQVAGDGEQRRIEFSGREAGGGRRSGLWHRKNFGRGIHRRRADHSTISGQDPDAIKLFEPVSAPPRAAEIRCDAAGRLEIVASQPGIYELKTAGGKTRQIEISVVPAPQEISGAWNVSFPPKWGAPEKITLDHLISLSDSTNAGVKYFSGTATYTKTFDWKPVRKIRNQKTESWLDLGDVQVMARVKLNGHDLGVLWKQPFRVNVTGALKPGRNTLEIRVADLWPNRMIGDAALPEAERFTWSSYEPFTKDSPLPKSGLLGPVTLQTTKIAALP